MALDADDRRVLGGIVRAAFEAAVRGGRYVPEDPGRAALEERCGCFVTLKVDGALRGCLGCFVSRDPLYRTAAEYAAFSALEDPRFAGRRIGVAELDRAGIEVSVLSLLEACPEPGKIRLGVHGIYVSGHGRSGCFLPQVATETGWSVEEFWGHCCRDKAGLAWDAWREPGVEVKTFTAEAFEC